MSKATLKKMSGSFGTSRNLHYRQLFKEGVVAGVGWAAGVTIGFVLLSTVLVVFFNFLGGLPVIGSWIAKIVEATQEQLTQHTISLPK